MNLYIAGSFNERFRLRAERDILIGWGYKVKASWLDIPVHEGVLWPEEDEARREAARDLDEIGWADRVIVDTNIRSSTGGSDVEMGYAYGRMKHVWVVGPVRNGYHHLAQRRFETWKECREALRGQN